MADDAKEADKVADGDFDELEQLEEATEPAMPPGTVVSVIMGRFSSKWMEVAKLIATDPKTERRCPQCLDARLEIADAPCHRDRALIERIVRCDTCDVEVSIELRPQPA
jgi:hypothetical protein